MENWYEMYDFADSKEFLEKIELDDADISTVPGILKKGMSSSARDNAWIRKRKFKKKMVRTFLSLNPAQDYSKLGGMHCRPAIYIHLRHNEDGTFRNPKDGYCMNPYTKVFLSPRGALRKYRGEICYSRCGSFALGSKDVFVAKLTNKRIRQAPLGEAASYSYWKKVYGPKAIDLW